MKHVLTTLISCLVLLSTTLSTPALAEVKDEVAQSDASVVQDALTVAACGVQSVLNGAKTQITELFSTSEQVALDENESAPAPVRASSQDTVSVGAVSSILAGVDWSQDYTTCTLQSGYSFDGQTLRQAEIAQHQSTLTTFKAEDGTSLTGSAFELFSGCTSLTTVDLASSFDTSAVTDMGSMFAYCSNLTSLTLPKDFNTSAVTDMFSMFADCSSLTSLTLPNDFRTSSVENMSNMFYNCSSLSSLTFPDAFNTSAVIFMESMFSGCSGLTSLSLPDAFNTGAVLHMDSMFSGCSGLTSLELPDAFTAARYSMANMFQGTSALKSLTLAKNFALKSGTGLAGLNNSATSHTSFWITDITTEVTYATDEAASVAAINAVLTSLPSSASSQTFTLATRAYTFAGNGGVFGTGDSAPSTFSYYGNQGDRLGETPSPTYTGYKQTGWWSAPVDGTEVTIPAIFGTDQETTVYAHWMLASYTITFNANGLTFKDGSTEKSEAFDLGADLTAPELSLSPDVEFIGWFTEPTGGAPMPDTCSGDATYYAHYTMVPPGPTPPGPTPGPTPEPTPDVMPAADIDALPLTGDMSAALRNSLFVVLLGVLALFVAGYSLSHKRSL